MTTKPKIKCNQINCSRTATHLIWGLGNFCPLHVKEARDIQAKVQNLIDNNPKQFDELVDKVLNDAADQAGMPTIIDQIKNKTK